MGCGNQAIPSLGRMASDQGFQNYVFSRTNIRLRPMADCGIFVSRTMNVRILYVNNKQKFFTYVINIEFKALLLLYVSMMT
jgi:hypothetical protein